MPITHSLEPFRISEIPEIGELARAIWRQHYASIIGSAQIEYMLQNMDDHIMEKSLAA